jgi:hypothetical protein
MLLRLFSHFIRLEPRRICMAIDQLSYMNLPGCIKISNGTVDLIVTTSVGPRILFYGRSGGQNHLGQFPENSVKTALGVWRPYGGHRLWVWPELFPATYAPDNAPIQHRIYGDLSLTLHQPVDGASIEKQIRITLAPSGSKVSLEHTVTSRNLWPIDVAVWAITVVQSGTAIIPRVPFQTHDHYAPVTQPLALCAFTDLEDPRFTLGLKYILLRADPARANPQKIGLRNKEGWCAHLLADELFVKRFGHENRADYPDYGVNTEVYVEGAFQEVELLGPRRVVWPGESLTLSEEWHLFSGMKVDPGAGNLDQLDRAITPAVQSVLSQ